MTDRKTMAKYNVAKVEAVILEVAVELHPRHLTRDELMLQIVSDPDDHREAATGARAMRNLREVGLLGDTDGELVKPTRAAVRAVALLA
jgi:hypothetical protein